MFSQKLMENEQLSIARPLLLKNQKRVHTTCAPATPISPGLPQVPQTKSPFSFYSFFWRHQCLEEGLPVSYFFKNLSKHCGKN